jgi:hypothetical protein
VFATLLFFLSSTVSAQSQGDDKPKSWYDRLSFSGDLRLRYEGFQKDDAFDDGRRDRLRYRFRVGFDTVINDFISVGAQLRSGNPLNPVSDNQSFAGGFDKDFISISEAFAAIQPADVFTVTAGKFSHSGLWTVSDLHWDDDVVLEGIFERVELEGGDDGLFDELGLSFYQLVLEELGSDADGWILGFQAGPTFPLGEGELTFGVGFDSFSKPQNVLLRTLAGRLAGNDVTNLINADGQLVSDFRVLNVYAEWGGDIGENLPLDLSFFAYKNTGAADVAGVEAGTTGARGIGSDNDTAYYFRAAVGSYSAPGDFEGRFTYYYSEPDALFYAFVQSDTGRSTNVKGPRFDVRIGMPARTFVNFTYYRTSPVLGEDTTLNRWQLDYILRF